MNALEDWLQVRQRVDRETVADLLALREVTQTDPRMVAIDGEIHDLAISRQQVLDNAAKGLRDQIVALYDGRAAELVAQRAEVLALLARDHAGSVIVFALGTYRPDAEAVTLLLVDDGLRSGLDQVALDFVDQLFENGVQHIDGRPVRGEWPKGRILSIDPVRGLRREVEPAAVIQQHLEEAMSELGSHLGITPRLGIEWIDHRHLLNVGLGESATPSPTNGLPPLAPRSPLKGN